MKDTARRARFLYSGFLDAARRFPERPAIEIGDTVLTYRELADRSASIAATMQSLSPERPRGLTGVFGHRSFAAFAGVLGALLRGDGYVPLNPAFPADRSRAMALRAMLDWIVVEKASLSEFEQMLDGMEDGITVLIPDAESAGGADLRFPQHRFLLRKDLVPARKWVAVETDPDSLAYLLFTSGSTGQPKGVMVSQHNVLHFVDAMIERYDIDEHDRFSQTFDLTFDLSAFDMFVAWEIGACVCCPTQSEKLLPGRYITDHAITVWFSVPSTAVLMKKLRMLKAGKYPLLRYSLFCGEALPLEVAETFQQAAPNSTLENLYGPTELTIACTLYRYEKESATKDSEFGIVPIGDCYPGMKELIVDETLNKVESGAAGELLMTGPQLTRGYWKDEELTETAFIVPPGSQDVYYRTGDRVRRVRDGGPLVYLGRVDNQIKVQGYRVELGEIEAVIRELANTDVAVAIGYPSSPSGIEGIVAFVSSPNIDVQSIRDEAQHKLPPYMQPQQVLHIDEFPLNANGKVDRGALLRMLQTA